MVIETLLIINLILLVLNLGLVIYQIYAMRRRK